MSAHKLSAVLALTVVLVVALCSPGLAVSSRSHLGNIAVGEIVNLTTDGYVMKGVSKPFQYDGFGPGLVIPNTYSFVVTDIFIIPYATANDDTRFTSVSISSPDNRTLTFQFKGIDTHHYPLTGGLAFRSGQEPAAHVSTSSTGAGYVKFQLLGYFVKKKALPGGEPRF